MEKEKVLSDYLGMSLVLYQPKFLKNYFELKCNDTVIATAQNPKWYKFDLEIAWDKEKWIIYRPSIWRSLIEIKEADKMLPFATFSRKFWRSDGIVDLPMGQQLKIFFRIFKGTTEIRTINDEVLVLIKDKISFKDKTEFYIQQRSAVIDKNPWVIFLAWYLNKQRKQRSS